MKTVAWTDYVRYRAELRGFDLHAVEQIVRFSGERYFDTSTERMIAVGRYGDDLIMVPYDETDNTMTPVTMHATTRQQINFRLQTGRFRP